MFLKFLTHGVHVKIEIWTDWVERVHPAEESIVPVVGVCQSDDAAGDWSASVAGNEADWAVSPPKVIFSFLQLEKIALQLSVFVIYSAFYIYKMTYFRFFFSNIFAQNSKLWIIVRTTSLKLL